MVQRREGLPLTPGSLDAQRVTEDVWVTQNSVLGQDAHTSYTGWVVTPEGAVVIDPGNFRTCHLIREAIAADGGKTVNYIVYTHAHGDHTIGAPAFIDQKPKVIAHENAIPRLDRYKLTADHIRRINSIQFHFPIPPQRFSPVYPTDVYHDRFEFTLGGVDFKLIHAKGETDDHTLVWLPDMKTVFCGDLLEASFPNLGNPFKVQRYAHEWADALETVLALDPQHAIGGDIVISDKKKLSEVCRDNIALFRFLEDSVVSAINAGKNLEQIIEGVQLPPGLQNSPNLKQVYSRREFAIHNVWKRYCGYFNFSPSGLLPRPRREIAGVIRALIGDDEAVLQKARGLLQNGQLQLALETLDIILDADAGNTAARQLRHEVLQRLAATDTCLMSRNVWVHYLEADEEFLRSASTER